MADWLKLQGSSIEKLERKCQASQAQVVDSKHALELSILERQNILNATCKHFEDIEAARIPKVICWSLIQIPVQIFTCLQICTWLSTFIELEQQGLQSRMQALDEVRQVWWAIWSFLAMSAKLQALHAVDANSDLDLGQQLSWITKIHDRFPPNKFRIFVCFFWGVLIGFWLPGLSESDS